MPYPREHNAPFPVLQDRVVFMVKVMLTSRTTNTKQDPAIAGNLHTAICQPDSDHKTASKQEMQF